MKQIPNLLTLLNLALGCMAIVFILQPGQTIAYIEPTGFSSWDLPERITWGALCIFAAAVMDFFDGFAARLLKAGSAIGRQLDSLADIVSFGVAPGLIMYQLLRISFAKEEGGLDVSMAWLLPALLVPCAAAWRLARFNIDERQQVSFRGVPTPAAGLTIASLPLIIFYQQLGLHDVLTNKWLLYFIIVFISYLMVSNLQMMNLKFGRMTPAQNRLRIVMVITAVAAVLLLNWVAVPVIFIVYLILSLLNKKSSDEVYSAGKSNAS